MVDKGEAMSRDIFKDRERGFEEEFFLKQDARLIEKIRERAKLEEIAHALADKLQVDNPELLRRVIDLRRHTRHRFRFPRSTTCSGCMGGRYGDG